MADKNHYVTTKEHYVKCTNCGPLIGKRVRWDYVRKNGRCLKCLSNNLVGKLIEVKDGKEILSIDN